MANQIGKALASARIATPPNLDDSGLEWSAWRRSTQRYMWGAQSAIINGIGGAIDPYTGLNSGSGDTLRAYAQVFPVAGTVTSVVWHLLTNMVAGQAIQFGMYSDNGNVYPATREFDSGSLTLLSGAVSTIQTFTPNVHVEANSVHWLVFNFNDAFAPNPFGANGQSMLWYAATGNECILGYADGLEAGQLDSENRYSYGWKIGQLQSLGMPLTFPAGSTLITGARTTDNTNAIHPVFLYKFIPDPR